MDCEHLTPPLHQGLADGRWHSLSLMEQLANIGSETGRAISWHKRGNLLYRDHALHRTLELIDLTLSDLRWRGRLREITRTREVLCDLFYGENVYNVSMDELEKYFYSFAYAVRYGSKPSQ